MSVIKRENSLLDAEIRNAFQHTILKRKEVDFKVYRRSDLIAIYVSFCDLLPSRGHVTD